MVHSWWRWAFGAAVCCGALVAVSSAAEFYVRPDGSPQGDGSREAPWDLATALSQPEAVQPGDTIWLGEGTYRGGYTSQLTGTVDAPIVVRGQPGGRVTIDMNPRDERDSASFNIAGADVVFRDFEVMSSHPVRVTEIAGSWPADIRRGSVDVRGSRIRLVNLVVHDLAGGFGFWSSGEGGEISGCLIYNNGWRGPDRGHGHGIYAQNALGTKRLADNIIFHQFGYGIHVYGSEKASLKGFEIEGNIVFENGCLAATGNRTTGILVGGGSPAERIAVNDNVVYGGNVRLGYTWGAISEDVVCTGNYIDGGLVVRDFRSARVRENTVVAESNVVQLEGAERLLLDGLDWDENTYFVTDGRWGECAAIEQNKSRGVTFAEWREVTGADGASTLTRGAPTEPRVVVRPSLYEGGRAHVAVVNPGGLSEVELDLSQVLTEGDPFRILSAKDPYGEPLVQETYTGAPVKLPMRAVAGIPPVGLDDVELPVTEPYFGAYVVLPHDE
jgi:hypothetical protein